MHRLIFLILLLSFFIACRSNSGLNSTPQPAERVLITLAVEEISIRHYQPLIKLFEQEHPNIQVQLVSANEVTNSDDSEIWVFASSFDVFPYSPNRQGETQYLLDLRPYINLDPTFDSADFLPGLLPEAPEPLYAIPTSAAYYITYFDKAAFDTAGHPYPALDWTTDDFLETAVALTTRDADEVTRWGYVPTQMRYTPLLAAQLSGPLQTNDGLRLQDPDVAEAVSWVSDLFTEYEVAPWLDEYRPAERRSGGDPSPMALIADGQAAIWHTTHVLYDENESNVEVTAVPQGDFGLAAEPLITGFAASRGTANPEAAWELLDFLTRQPPQDNIFQVVPVPARRSVAAATNFWAQLPPELAPALQYTAENSVPPRITYQAANLLWEAFATHIDDGVSVIAALEQRSEVVQTPPQEGDVEIAVIPTTSVEDYEEFIQITFATEYSLLETHRRLANQFQEESNIMVHVVQQGEVINPFEQIAGNDCFLGQPDHWQNDQAIATLLPLDPLIDLDNTLRLEAFYPIMIEPLIFEGELWGIPAGMSIPYMEYNRQIFQEASVPPPPLDWTFNDFLQVAQRVTQGEGETRQYGYADPFNFFFGHGVQAFGVPIVDSSTAVPRFDYEAAVEMLTWYADLVRLHEVQPLLRDADFSNFLSLLRGGQVAIWPGGFASIGPDQTPLDFEVGVASIPTGPSGYQGQSYVFSYHIFANSSNQAACLEWIKFLSTHPLAMRTASSTQRIFPAHIVTAESAEHVQQLGADMTRIAQEFINSSQTILVTDTPQWMRPGFDWLRVAYQEVSSGEIDVTAALVNADEKFTRYRECVIHNDAFDSYATWRACALQVDPDLEGILVDPD